jgi:type IV pilus assembly protein PilV
MKAPASSGGSPASSARQRGAARRLARQGGDTLAEVLIAMGLLGVAVLGSVALQISVAQSQDAARCLEQAVRIGQSAAEALRGGISAGNVAGLVRNSLVALPDGRLAIVSPSPGLSQVTVHWTEPRGRYGVAQSRCQMSAGISGARMPRCFVLQVAI